MNTLTKPPVIPDGYNPNPSDKEFNQLFAGYKNELLPNGVKKKRRTSKKQMVSPWVLNTLKIA